MIAFSSGSYTFLNYVDNVNSLTLLFKIVEIINKHVEIPALGKNSVIVWNTGKVETSGSPYPGGVIYLQNDYVAIDYDENKIGFSLYFSKGYKYNDFYHQLLPTHHYSTPLSRLLMVPPEELIFVKGGIIGKYPAAVVNGVDADYIALDEGEAFAAFGVKERTYPCLPFPNNVNDIRKTAFIANVINKAEGCMYHKVGGVSGLKNSPEIKTYIEQCRTLMSQYEKFTVDINKASGFAAPVSDSLATDGLIFSALNPIVGKQYLNDKLELKQPINGLIPGLIFSEVDLLELMCNPVPDEDGLENFILKYKYVPAGVTCLLNSEFNSILQLYNDTFIKYKKIASMSALKRMKSDVGIVLSKLKKISNSVLRDIVLKWANTNANPLMSAGINVDSLCEFITYDPYEAALSVLSWDPDNKEEDASLYTSKITSYMEYLGHDCSITDEEFDALANTPADDAEEAFAIPLINTDAVDNAQSVVRARLTASLLSQIIDGLMNINKNGVVTTDSCVYTRENMGRYFPRINKNLDIQMFGGANFNISYNKLTITNNCMVVNYHATCDSIDMDMRKWMDTCKTKITNAFRSVVGHGASDVTVSMYLSDSICGCSTKAWNNTRTFDRAKDWKGRYITVHLVGQITYPIAVGTINLPTISDAILNPNMSIYYPELIPILKEGDVNVQRVNKKVLSVIDIFASNVAYDLCGYLFEACKENYEFQAIGVLGTSYEGIPVLISELAYVSAITPDYVNGIIRLINESPMDDVLRNNLAGFVNSLQKAVAIYANARPIYYLSKNSVLTAAKSDTNQAFYHYLYGAI